MALKTFVSPLGRFIWVHLREPNTQFDASNDKLELTLIFDSSEDLSQLRAQIENELARTVSADVRSRLEKEKKLFLPLKPNTKQVNIETGEIREGFEDGAGFYLTVRTKNVPIVVDAAKKPIGIEAAQPGCWGKAAISLHGYHKAGRAGVSVWLSAVQVLQQDEPLGSVDPSSLFQVESVGAVVAPF